MLVLRPPMVMGILNVTPDSFSDGGNFIERDKAIEHALRMIEEGADIIDVGGESTRPGAERVLEEEEWRRVIPVVEAIRAESDIPISVDTSTPSIIRNAASLGANLINDVRALQREGALAALAETDLRVCLMHMQGDPGSMQKNPSYNDLFGEIHEFFEGRISACINAGIQVERIILDPGFGFGKTVDQNLELIRRVSEFQTLGCPLLVGLSRKSTIAKVLEDVSGNPATNRLMGSVAGAVVAYLNGASILRVHDVGETVSALAVAAAIKRTDD